MPDCDVLVVEDDGDIRELVSEVLREEGYRVESAANGREALETLGGGLRPRLLLLDLMMPEVSGWQVLEAMRGNEQLAPIPVVVVTAFPTEAPPAHEVVRKPFHLEGLLATVERFCRQPIAHAHAVLVGEPGRHWPALAR